jgi:hypothetical protein
MPSDSRFRLIPTSLRHWPRWAWLTPIIVVATYGFLLAACSDASLPTLDEPWQLWPYLSVQPVGEDAFYYLSVAWHLAEGQGLTAHGHTSVTGIQPMFPILLAIPAKLVQWTGGSKWTFIRVVIVLMTLNVCLLPLLTARLAERISNRIRPESDWRVPLVVFLLTITSFSLFRLISYGLETGLYLSLIIVAVLASYRLDDRPSARTGGDSVSSVWTPVGIGVIFGVTGLARIDFGIALAVFFVIGLSSGWFRLRDALVSGAVALVLVSPWLGYVYYHMGTIIPSSGIAESAYIPSERFSRRLLGCGQSLMEITTPGFFVHLGNRVANVGGFVACIFVTGTAWLFRDDYRDLLTPRALGWLASFLALAVVYVASLRSVHFYHRYFSPLYLFVLPVFALAVVKIVDQYLGVDRIRGWLPHLIALLLIQFFVWAGFVLHRDTAVTTQFLAADTNQALAARAIADHVPEDRGPLGAFQSGTIGYFHDDVVNLDGKVNNDVIDYLADKDVCGYLDDRGIQYIVGWFTFIDHHLSACIEQNWTTCGPEFPGPYICLRRK